jgi:ADP-ribose pyrophosphatase YjhB (NUDIX family)
MTTLEAHPSYPKRNLTPEAWEEGKSYPEVPFFEGMKTHKPDASHHFMRIEGMVQDVTLWLAQHFPTVKYEDLCLSDDRIFPTLNFHEMNVDWMDGGVTGKICISPRGLPVNPWGNYHMDGRGEFRHFGVHLAADVTVIIRTPKGQPDKVLVLRRKDDDGRSFAFPGGFIELPQMESTEETAARELSEETGGVINVESSRVKRLVDFFPCKTDPRTTNNAWVFTFLHVVILDESELARPLKDDTEGSTEGATFMDLTDALQKNMWNHHKDLFDLVVSKCDVEVGSFFPQK